MSNLLVSLLVGAGIIVIMIVFHIVTTRRREQEMRDERERLENAVTGVGAMAARSRASSGTVEPISKAKKPSSPSND